MRSFFTEEPAFGMLRLIQGAAAKKNKTLYCVGGILRDLFAGRSKRDPDIDFVLKDGSIGFARHVARLLHAGFVALDEERGTGRVVSRQADGTTFTFDFSDFKGKGLEEDIALRDFTANSLAAPLERLLSGESLERVLIDPLGGRRDIRRRLVRACGPKAFDDDPLRVLRAFSTAALLGGAVEPATLRRAARKKGLLASVSRERIRDELFKILAVSRGRAYIELMDRCGVLETVFPEIIPMKRMRRGNVPHLDVWGHTLETFGKLEQARSRLSRLEGLEGYLGAEMSSGRSRFQVLKLAALLHDIGKPKTYRFYGGKARFYGHDREGARIAADICGRLRLSKEEERSVRRVVALHLRPGFLAASPKLTAKARFRFFRDAREEAGAVLILALADLRATRGYRVVEETRGRQERMIKRLLREFFRRAECPPPARLVTGDDLIRIGLEPSPVFGKILRALDEMQAERSITTKEEGLREARKIAGKPVTKEH